MDVYTHFPFATAAGWAPQMQIQPDREHRWSGHNGMWPYKTALCWWDQVAPASSIYRHYSRTEATQPSESWRQANKTKYDGLVRIAVTSCLAVESFSTLSSSHWKVLFAICSPAWVSSRSRPASAERQTYSCTTHAHRSHLHVLCVRRVHGQIHQTTLTNCTIYCLTRQRSIRCARDIDIHIRGAVCVAIWLLCVCVYTLQLSWVDIQMQYFRPVHPSSTAWHVGWQQNSIENYHFAEWLAGEDKRECEWQRWKESSAKDQKLMSARPSSGQPIEVQDAFAYVMRVLYVWYRNFIFHFLERHLVARLDVFSVYLFYCFVADTRASRTSFAAADGAAAAAVRIRCYTEYMLYNNIYIYVYYYINTYGICPFCEHGRIAVPGGTATVTQATVYSLVHAWWWWCFVSACTRTTHSHNSFTAPNGWGGMCE